MDAVALLCIMIKHRSLCASLVVSVVLLAPVTARAQSNADIQAGKTLFSGMCVTCHGFDGTGGAGPPLDRPKLLLAPDPREHREAVFDLYQKKPLSAGERAAHDAWADALAREIVSHPQALCHRDYLDYSILSAI